MQQATGNVVGKEEGRENRESQKSLLQPGRESNLRFDESMGLGRLHVPSHEGAPSKLRLGGRVC